MFYDPMHKVQVVSKSEYIAELKENISSRDDNFFKFCCQLKLVYAEYSDSLSNTLKNQDTLLDTSSKDPCHLTICLDYFLLFKDFKNAALALANFISIINSCNLSKTLYTAYLNHIFSSLHYFPQAFLTDLLLANLLNLYCTKDCALGVHAITSLRNTDCNILDSALYPRNNRLVDSIKSQSIAHLNAISNIS